MNGHSNETNFNQNYENFNSQSLNCYNQNYAYPPAFHNNYNNCQSEYSRPTAESIDPNQFYYQMSLVDNSSSINHHNGRLANTDPVINNNHNNIVASYQPRSANLCPPYSHTVDQSSINDSINTSFPNYPPPTISNVSAHNYVQPRSTGEYQSYYQPTAAPRTASKPPESMRSPPVADAVSQKVIDLMQKRHLFGEGCNTDFPIGPKTVFPVNCDPKVMQCTLNTLPIEANTLTKSRLPLGVHIQPFRDMDIVTVSTNSIVRCRPCRTYINPFVTLTDNQRRWHCNVCGKVNDIPDEFMYDPSTKSYGNPSQRPELKYCNIEYTANPEYTVRPPMSTIYVFLLDVSKSAISSGYLSHACKIIIDNISEIPGDSRSQIAFFTYSSSLNLYEIQENSYKMIIWPDVDEIELPLSEDLLVNLHERKDIILEFLERLPSDFSFSNDSGNCLGFALQMSRKLIGHNGGRVTVINASLPNVGPGALKVREYREGDLTSLKPETDFYKDLALNCANDQISVDLFCINHQYSDIACISALTRHSSGCFQYYGNFKAVTTEGQRLESEEQLDFDRFTKDFKRYLTRKIGFEAVMRTRFTRGLDLTAFHGNLFMRSTNVIALPVVNPDNSYLIQFKINNNLSDWNYVIIQSALLYTTSESDRRIRVHTMCLPLSSNIEEIFFNCNSSAITGLITKIAVDKCLSSGFNNVRQAFVNSLVDPLKVFNDLYNKNSPTKAVLCPISMRCLAPFVLGLLRNPAFRPSSMNLDERIAIYESLRSLPLTDVLHRIYPYMVSVHQLSENISLNALAHNRTDDNSSSQLPSSTSSSPVSSETDQLVYPTRLNLTSSVITRDGAFLMDAGICFYLFLGNSVSSYFLKNCFSIDEISQLPKDGLVTNLDLNNVLSKRLLKVKKAIAKRSIGTSVITVLPDCKMRNRILNYLVEDRMENSMSYFEFMKSIQSQIYS